MTQPDPIAQKAIEWLVLLHSGDITNAERDAFNRWRAESARHERVCVAIERMLETMPKIADAPGLRRAVEQGDGRRQFLRNTLGVSAFLTLAGLLYNQYSPVRGLAADLQTRTGERLNNPLRDGSRLSLDARTALDFSVGPKQRTLRLIQGLIYVEVAPSEMPFVIQTQDGIISLPEGQVTVDLYTDATRVAVLKNTASVLTTGGQRSVLQAGQGGVIATHGFELESIDSSRELSWLQGFVEIDDQPLNTLINRLRVYRAGVIRVDADVAQMRVSGVFPLDDTDSALETLQQTLPVVINRRTDYWISIGRKV
ncbi:FecR domain-containing protein [Pseudomonas syringae]|uniref:FecR family protein n=1 Tax=Pseudomonas syringae TaxID=317 RepID=UPI0034D64C63